MTISIVTLLMVDVFARGGGGGSGGGGGGGAGGIALLGYLPAHFTTDRFYKHRGAVSAYIAGSIVALLVTIPSLIVSTGYGIIIGIGAIVGVYSGTHNLLIRMAGKTKQSKLALDKAASQDPQWSEVNLQTRITKVFYDYQRDWSSFNLVSMRSYMTPRYFQHARLLATALYQLGRQNIMDNVRLDSIQVINAVDQPENDNDNFTAFINAGANDVLVERATNNRIYTDTSFFQEFWQFDRKGDEWLLDGITQATENPSQTEVSLKSFAAEQSMYYSGDMGWLLLPQRGQLFSKANFKTSDVNNHVIGEWDGQIVQLYTYIPATSGQRADNYLIGQMSLPKSYGGIIVKRRGTFGWLHHAPRNYQTIQFEWPDFNKRYTVWATDMDKVTSFELLNPAFMVKLYDSNLPINIEVVDNIVYFYCRMAAAEKRYPDMLNILKLAFNEMRL